MTKEPGSGTTDFGILRIEAIREDQSEIVLKDDLRDQFSLKFHEFATAFIGTTSVKDSTSHRIAPIADANGFVSTMKSRHPSK